MILFRKTMLVLVVSIVPAQRSARVLAGLTVLLVPLLLQLIHRPQRSRTHNRLESLALLVTFVSLFVGLSIGLEIVASEATMTTPTSDAEEDQVPFVVALALISVLNGGIVLALLGVVLHATRKAWSHK